MRLPVVIRNVVLVACCALALSACSDSSTAQRLNDSPTLGKARAEAQEAAQAARDALSGLWPEGTWEDPSGAGRSNCDGPTDNSNPFRQNYPDSVEGYSSADVGSSMLSGPPESAPTQDEVAAALSSALAPYGYNNRMNPRGDYYTSTYGSRVQTVISFELQLACYKDQVASTDLPDGNYFLVSPSLKDIDGSCEITGTALYMPSSIADAVSRGEVAAENVMVVDGAGECRDPLSTAGVEGAILVVENGEIRLY